MQVKKGYIILINEVMDSVETYPHHKHVGRKENLQPSHETLLEEVMNIVLGDI